MVIRTEENFEATIEAYLLAHGWQKKLGTITGGDYDRTRCLIPDDVMTFIETTQPEEWQKVKARYGDNARESFLNRLASQIESRGTLTVLREGISDRGGRFKLVFFRPATSLNPDLQEMYRGNRFTVARQLHFSEVDTAKSLDMTLFINGIPIATVELKNPFTGQRASNAKWQYRHTRNPDEPLFKFGHCLVHFAVDSDEVWMTTHLRGEKTYFLPFNKGRFGGAGNVQLADKYAVSYLWEEICQTDSILNLLQKFIYEIDDLDDKGNKTGKRLMIFPRYHQLDAVRRLTEHGRNNGVGHRYLIQHSAGSGKTYSISWLAHQLSNLHNEQDVSVFDSVIVITDRRVLDSQLQTAIAQFEQVSGVVENIDQTSSQLKDALQMGKRIIVTTLQKFPVIVDQIGELVGNHFAIIVDEAHSSQSGENTKAMKTVLSMQDNSEDNLEIPDYEDLIAQDMRARKHQPNLSIFAFTATPKQKTLELFGTQAPNGTFEPFSLYSMRQAIEEGFILDVLKNYTTYKAYWRLLKRTDDNPEYESGKARQLLRKFVDEHPETIRRRVEIIVEHFHTQVAHQINNQAKVMIVTKSRPQAVRYFIELRNYLTELGYPYEAMVAFSGTVVDDDEKFTETSLNAVPESRTVEVFKQLEKRFMVVANKFQTGFDQPLLHTMYVDKHLSGVHAVQTLSRLNRTTEGKDSAIVIDFINEAEHIQKAFEPYYQQTVLSEATDPNLLYDRETELRGFRLYSTDEVEHFVRLLYAPGTNQSQLHAPLQPAIDRYEELAEEEQSDFRSKVVDYIRQYAFLSQVLPFEDLELEKLYQYFRFLLRKLPIEPTTVPYEVLNDVDIEAYTLRETYQGDISPSGGSGTLDPINTPVSGNILEDPEESLMDILNELNKIYGVDLTEEDYIRIADMHEKIETDAAVVSSKEMPEDKASMTIQTVAERIISDTSESNIDFYIKLMNHERFRNELVELIKDSILRKRAS